MIRKFCDRCGSEIIEKKQKKQTFGEIIAKQMTEFGLNLRAILHGEKREDLPGFKIYADADPLVEPLILCEQCDQALRVFMTEIKNKPKDQSDGKNITSVELLEVK